MRITFYQTAMGNTPVRKYLDKAKKEDVKQIAAVLLDINKNGLRESIVSKRQIHEKMWELKIGKHRVLYTIIYGPEMVLHHAYRKQGQKARREDISTAKSRLMKLTT